MSKIIIIGPGHPLRGGLATFNHRLAKEFIDTGNECSILSFSLQYPSFLFPGKTQFSNEPAPENIHIQAAINSINPFNWIKIGNRLKRERPDIIIVRYWLPFMGPALGTILRRVRKNKHSKIICIADNIMPHEKRPGDKAFTKYFLKCCDAFVTMSDKVLNDLRLFEKSKPAQLIAHPLYDNFGAIMPKQEARKHLHLPGNDKIILFFGFIRKYKGLDLLLDAMAKDEIKQSGIKLLVAGEFYEDQKQYIDQIEKLGIQNQLIMKTDFIPDSEVKYYFCAADAVIQPYRNATQSGVTPLAYYFEKPMVITNVGSLTAMVTNNETAIVTAPDSTSMAKGILKFYDSGENKFLPFLMEKKKQYSWTTFGKQILNLANEIHH